MIKRLTISVRADVARRIRKAARRKSVSAWLAQAAVEQLDRESLERAWEAFYADVSPTRAEVRKADEAFERLTSPRRRKGAA